jgi:putative Mg2+ transporter-C (MgtC) family protein
MGFLGAGAILKRGTLVQGVTTAAALWFISIVGLCFGAGYIGIGLAGTAVAIVALFILPSAERYFHADHMSTITIVTRHEGITEEELRQRLCALGLDAQNFTIDCQVSEKLKTICCEVEYQRKRSLELPPKVIADLSHQRGVVEVKWE